MAYVLEKITEDDKQKILAIADERQRIRLKAYGFLRDNDDLVWAINKECGYFLMRAPTQGVDSTIPYFFFHFNDRLFNLSVVMNFSEVGDLYEPIKLQERPSPEYVELFQAELTEAFDVHRLYGHPEAEPPFVPTFKTEGN